jgi:hypothetical protein
MTFKKRPSIVIGHTSDEIPEIVLGIETVTINLSLDHAADITTQLKNLIRRLRRNSWKYTGGNSDE